VPTLLVVHHTTSPALESMLDAVLAGTRGTASTADVVATGAGGHHPIAGC
jgi:hypothetical protein